MMHGSRGVETYKPHKICNTCGRRRGSSSQHCCVIVHNASVKVGSIGLGGRSPPMVANRAARGVFLPKGTAPVNTFVQMSGVLWMSILSLQRTSIMTIANEKTSASLLNAPRLARISGAVHRVLCPCSSGAPCIESRFRVTTARPQSVIIT